ncbi:MAG: membrane protein insertase YidC, partial [Deltaproteobacteria bacterium]|nr:membrane protein insertase YidC [Deltaproteobacteria bacterium]
MDMYRAFLAIIISFLILIGYQYFFVPTQPTPPPVQTEQQPTAAPAVPATAAAPAAQPAAQPAVPAVTPPKAPVVAVDKNARDITVDTPLYTAVFFEQGGGLKSFILKKYRIEKDKNAAPMELVMTSNPAELPLVFTLDNGAAAILPVFRTDREKLSLQAGSTGELVMTATLENGLTLTRTLSFDGDSYLFSTDYTVSNSGSAAQQVTPAMVMTSAPFSAANSTGRYLFSGPVAYVNNELQEIKGKKLTAGPLTMQGAVSWSAYEDNYFICAVIPEQNTAGMVTMSAAGDTVRTVVGGGLAGLAAGESKTFRYKAYFGPKKLSVLKDTGDELAKAVNFGWFDVLAKPMLFLLNFFYSYIGNYGVAIILLTCLIKGAFWPITQKGMKSMKNMQKLQPRVAKLKEKFKDDPAKMN